MAGEEKNTMQTKDRKAAFQWFVGFWLMATFFLLFAGALVTSTGSGLAVPDWPLSFGKFFPPMQGGVFYEHGHRMIAGAVGVITLFATALMVRLEKRVWVKKLAFGALALVVLQSLLGGLTVILKLPVIVSVFHALLAQLFLSTVGLIFLSGTSLWSESTAQAGTLFDLKKLKAGSVVLVALFTIQLWVGAGMRHTGSGLAIPDFPTVFGGYWPTFWNSQIVFQMSHRILAMSIGVAVWFMTLFIYKKFFFNRALLGISGALMACTIFQILLGASVIWSRKFYIIASLHLVVGALMMALSWALVGIVMKLQADKKNLDIWK